MHPPPEHPNEHVAPGSHVIVHPPPEQPKKQVAPVWQTRVQPPLLQYDSHLLPASHVVSQPTLPHAWTQQLPELHVHCCPEHSLFIGMIPPPHMPCMATPPEDEPPEDEPLEDPLEEPLDEEPPLEDEGLDGSPDDEPPDDEPPDELEGAGDCVSTVQAATSTPRASREARRRRCMAHPLLKARARSDTARSPGISRRRRVAGDAARPLSGERRASAVTQTIKEAA